MYRKIRAIHRYAALASFPFLLVYFVSAVLMAHRTWFPSAAVKSKSTVSLSKGLTDARAVGNELMRDAEFQGELLYPSASATAVRMLIVRPGVSFAVSYSPSEGVAEVTTSKRGFAGVLTDLHKIAGLEYRYTTLRVWALVAVGVSLALLLLGLSGLYLWYCQTRERRTGLALLAVAGLPVAYLILSMRF